MHLAITVADNAQEILHGASWDKQRNVIISWPQLLFSQTVAIRGRQV
jgi:hypothetical protein